MRFVATIGVYDGVHSAHVIILQELLDMAKKHGVSSVVFTILYPMEYYSGRFDGLINTPQERMEILQRYVDEVFFLDLGEIYDLEPEEFIQHLAGMGMVGLVVGDDFRFGRKGRGDSEFLRTLCSDMGIDLIVVRELRTDDGVRISSSVIRKMIRKGDMKGVKRLLGRYYSISGRVYRDMGLGRKLGFPTANIDRGHEILIKPKNGVYFSRTRLSDGRIYFSVTNVGTRPTLGGEDVVKYETHILDFDEDIYGSRIEVELIELLREEKRFSNLEELRDAISLDVKKVRELMREWKPDS